MIPQTAPGYPPAAQSRGGALVAADGGRLCWAGSGHGSPDLHSAEVKHRRARAGELAPRPRLDVDLPAALHREDDDDNGWALLERDQFDPAVVFPAAVLATGRPGGSEQAQVLRTELFLATGGEVAVVVTFRQTGCDP